MKLMRSRFRLLALLLGGLIILSCVLSATAVVRQEEFSLPQLFKAAPSAVPTGSADPEAAEATPGPAPEELPAATDAAIPDSASGGLPEPSSETLPDPTPQTSPQETVLLPETEYNIDGL